MRGDRLREGVGTDAEREMAGERIKASATQASKGVEAADGKNRAGSTARPKKRVRRRNAAETRQRILEAALVEFGARGLDAARIEDIAAQAETNRRMAYYYFGSKEGLYLAALETSYLQLVEVEEAIDVEAMGPMEAIEALVAAKFEHYVRYPHYIEFVKMENLYQGRHLKRSTRIAEMRAPLISIIQRVLRRGEATGVMRRGVDPLELYLSICALGFFIFSNRHTLGVIFGVDVTEASALVRRRKLIVDMIRAYLTNDAADDDR
ncbi:TetR/AcrR family transcriptional regulator [Amorphus sp. MBR-141]